MKSRLPKKQTRAEEAYICDMTKKSAWEKQDRGEARILRPEELPAPLKRFRARERSGVHVSLPAAAHRRLQSLSRARGVAAEELARRWVEEGLEREAN
jgi:hypothetical protein